MSLHASTVRVRITTAVSLVAGVGLLVLLLRWYGSDLRVSLSQVRPGYAFLYAIAVPLVLAAYSARWKMLTRAIGTEVSLRFLMMARLAGDAVGMLLPSAKVVGDPVRIALLHGESVPLVNASAGVTLDRLCELAGNVVAATVYTMVFIMSVQGPADRSASELLGSVICLSAAVAVLVGLLWYGRRPLAPLYWVVDPFVGPRGTRFLDAVRAAEQRILAVFRDHRHSFMAGVVWSLLIEALVLVEYQLLLRMCGIFVSMPVLMLALVLGGLSRSLPSPAALGAFEASQVAALTIAGQPAATGLAIGLIVRLHETVLMVAGLMICVMRGVSPARLRVLVPAGGDLA